MDLQYVLIDLLYIRERSFYRVCSGIPPGFPLPLPYGYYVTADVQVE